LGLAGVRVLKRRTRSGGQNASLIEGENLLDVYRFPRIAMSCLTLGDLRRTGGTLEIECVRCGAVECRPAASLTGSDAMTLGAVGLTLACARCGARACIADAAPPEKSG
jgi:hypothetical protein